jgi:hypothetical protein
MVSKEFIELRQRKIKKMGRSTIARILIYLIRFKSYEELSTIKNCRYIENFLKKF